MLIIKATQTNKLKSPATQIKKCLNSKQLKTLLILNILQVGGDIGKEQENHEIRCQCGSKVSHSQIYTDFYFNIAQHHFLLF